MYFAGVNFHGSERITLFQFNLSKWHKSYFLCWTLQLCSKISHLFDHSYLTQALFQTIVGCDYRTQSSSLNFEKYVFIENGKKMCPKNMHPCPQYIEWACYIQCDGKDPIFWPPNKSEMDDRRFEKYVYGKVNVNNPCRKMTSFLRL